MHYASRGNKGHDTWKIAQLLLRQLIVLFGLAMVSMLNMASPDVAILAVHNLSLFARWHLAPTSMVQEQESVDRVESCTGVLLGGHFLFTC